MPILDLQPESVSEEESKIIASRQMLSFLTVSSAEASDRASSNALFSLQALPDNAFTERPALFDWTSREIHDVDGRLLLRSHTLDLGNGNEWAVSVAATNLLRTPVWRVKAGPKLNEESLIEKALAAVRENGDFEAVFVDGEKKPRLVAHNYPRLGLLCRSRTNPEIKAVIDIGTRAIIPLDTSSLKENVDTIKAVWSPYDIVVSSTVAHYRALWNRNLARIPKMPQSFGEFRLRVEIFSKFLGEVKTSPELKLAPQETDFFCAAASAQMILRQHGIDKSQQEIASEMNIGINGADINDQVKAIPLLTNQALEAELDLSVSFCEAQREIRQHRPFKTRGPNHARACGGFKVEPDGTQWLHIYNPWPANQGDIYYEAWDANNHDSYMYVRVLRK